MARGIRHIGRMNPLLDLWRMVYEAINTKGGIHEHEDEYKLIVEWIRAHQRAPRGESTVDELLRRDSNMADHLANNGRMLHVDDATCSSNHRLLRADTPTGIAMAADMHGLAHPTNRQRRCDKCRYGDIGEGKTRYR